MTDLIKTEAKYRGRPTTVGTALYLEFVAKPPVGRLIVKEGADLRGRKSGEAPKRLYQSAAEAMPGIERRAVLDEQDALELGIREMREGEIAVIFYSPPSR